MQQVRYLMTDTLLPSLKIKGGVMQVGTYRLAKVGYYKEAPLPPIAPRVPLPVDALLLQRGCIVPLAELLRYYSPSVLVLDASLNSQRRHEYLDAAQTAGINIYDVSENGAFRVPM